MNSSTKKVALIILDGLGLAPKNKKNAFSLAEMPFFKSLLEKYPTSELVPKGTSVGLPEHQMGNSEVGHLNIGAGTIVFQSLMRINNSIEDKSFYENKALKEALEHSKKYNSQLHLIGLTSQGGVHSHMSHFYSLLEMAKQQGLSKVFIHAFLDGRDTPMKSALKDIKELQLECEKKEIGKIATVSGRYYGMDRDKNYSRTQKVYDALLESQGKLTKSFKESIENSYKEDITDEFIEPLVQIDENNKPLTTIQENDAVIFVNFRPDRMRQLTEAIAFKDFQGFTRNRWVKTFITTFTQYSTDYSFPIAYTQTQIKNPLGKVLADAKIRQLRVAETEKYPHVTFFFNAMKESPYPLEQRILVPSPKVATYDLKPEMSALEITEKTLEEIKKESFDFLLLNYANPDMVGHTGSIPAAIKALETIDICLKKLVLELQKYHFDILITADHGNVEEMIDENGHPCTRHSFNNVPFSYLPENEELINTVSLKNGILADIAPTVLELFNLPKHPDMQGKSLIKQKGA